MGKGRLEAFSDGVIAILITIMVLELRAPHEADASALRPLAPVFLGYLMSFVYLGIYWNNHHHMLHAAREVNGRVLWANLHLLFWLSLVPFTTSWMGEHPLTTAPVALYGFVLLMAGVAYFFLAQALVAHHGADSPIAKAIGSDRKGRISVTLYVVAIAASWWAPWLSLAVYVAVAAMWFVPDRRIERALEGDGTG